MNVAGALVNPKGMDSEFKVPVPSAKGCFWDVLLCYPDLVIAAAQVNLGEDLEIPELCPRARQCGEGGICS